MNNQTRFSVSFERILNEKPHSNLMGFDPRERDGTFKETSLGADPYMGRNSWHDLHMVLLGAAHAWCMLEPQYVEMTRERQLELRIDVEFSDPPASSKLPSDEYHSLMAFVYLPTGGSSKPDMWDALHLRRMICCMNFRGA